MPSIWPRARLEPREGRKVIVVVTDGGDTTSRMSVHQALEAAQLADAVIYAIVVVPITNEAGRNIGGEHALDFMAKGTGGRIFMPTLGAELDKAFTSTSSPSCARNIWWVSTRKTCRSPRRPFTYAGCPGENAGFAGVRAQRLLWGGRGRGFRIAGRPHHRVAGPAAEASCRRRRSVRRSIRHHKENPRARRNRRLKRRNISNS